MLHINLLHEEQAKITERKRDPLKIGLLLLLLLCLFLYGYYLLRSTQADRLAAEVNGMKAELARLEPKAAAAKIDEEKSSQIMTATANIEKIINGRFYWGPFLSQIISETGADIQITSLDGTFSETTNSLKITIKGLSAGLEPRAVAERFRQNLTDNLGKTIGEASSAFLTLENNEARISLQDKILETAVFSIEFKIQPKPPETRHAKVQ